MKTRPDKDEMANSSKAKKTRAKANNTHASASGGVAKLQAGAVPGAQAAVSKNGSSFNMYILSLSPLPTL